MALKEIITVPASQSMPSNLAQHKEHPYIKHGVTTHSSKGTFTPSHGTRREYKQDVNLDVRNKDIFHVPAGNDTFRVGINAGSEHFGNVEVKLQEQNFNNTWKGLGFEYHQDSSSNNSLFLRYFAKVWWNVKENTHYTYGSSFDGESRKETVGYFYNKDTFSDQERSWQDGVWRLKGLIFNFRSTAGVGSSHNSYVQIFNLKFFSGDGSNSGIRLVLPAIRPSSEAYTPYF